MVETIKQFFTHLRSLHDQGKRPEMEVGACSAARCMARRECQSITVPKGPSQAQKANAKLVASAQRAECSFAIRCVKEMMRNAGCCGAQLANCGFSLESSANLLDIKHCYCPLATEALPSLPSQDSDIILTTLMRLKQRHHYPHATRIHHCPHATRPTSLVL